MIDDNDGFISTVTSESESKYDSSEVAYKFDASPMYDRSNNGMSGTEIDVELDKRPTSEMDKRGKTRTGFDPSDANGGVMVEFVDRDGKKRQYSKWLRLLQHGYRSKTTSRASENNEADTRSYVSIFSSRLELNEYQKDRTKAIIDSVNMGHMAHYSRETLVLAVISIVTNEDNRWIRDEQLFKELVKDIGSTMHDIKNARKLLKRKSPLL